MGFLAELDEALSAESLATLKRNFGLAPRVYRAQMLRPDLVDAQVRLLDRLLFTKSALSRVQKEFILLAVSAENNNSYFSALHCQTLQFLGIKADQSEQIAVDHRDANLSDAVASERQMIQPELADGFVSDDPDLEIVARVRSGETDAFEELVRKHGRRVYRSLLAIVGSAEEAEDALQDAFLKAFQHLANFEGRSRFSTWLVRIAINTGLQRVRSRKEFDSLDEENEEFRPRNIQPWSDTPEEFYSREELRRLVEKEVMKLPAKYRVALMLRDLEELSTEEAAAAVGLSVPGLKARVLRGRLMLREAMVQYFSKAGAGKS